MQKLQKFLDPYIRLGRFDKPIGGWLVFWPCTYASVLASSYEPITFAWTGLTFSACFMLRAAGCAANDMWDRDFDKHVERTKTRPIASGELSLLQAGTFCALNLAPLPVILSLIPPNGLFFLYCTVPVITLYPLAKRFTNWPQAILGVSMNYGFLVNYLTLTNTFDLFLVPTFAGLWCWTLVYDSIYAYQDVKDDVKVGIKSTAVVWKEDYRKYCARFTAGMAASFGVAGYMAELGSLFYPVMGIAVWRVMRQWRRVDIGDPKDCGEKFRDNHKVGMIMLLAFVVGKLSQKTRERDKKIELVE